MSGKTKETKSPKKKKKVKSMAEPEHPKTEKDRNKHDIKKKAKKSNNTEMASLNREVATFASSLGLASSQDVPAAFSGFNDVDFRKKGPIKPSKPDKHAGAIEDVAEKPKHSKKRKRGAEAAQNGGGDIEKEQKHRFEAQNGSRKQTKKPTPLSSKVHALFQNIAENVEGGGKGKAQGQKLQLVKPNALSNPWYWDSEALEAKYLKADAGVGVKAAASMSKSAWQDFVEKKRQRAQRLMEQYVFEYNQRKEKSSDLRMVSAAEKSGTTADKVAAITVLVQDNPIANLKALDSFLAMVASKVGKRHAANGIDPLKELFLISLLPDRKLKFLFQQPLHVVEDTKDGNSLLLFWYWEDCLKQRFERLVGALEDAAKDDLQFLKNKALKAMFDLLKNKPEQERRLLSSLVNKLGDPERKIASNAGYHLSRLLTAHPNMKAVVIDEVDNFIFRSNLGLRPRYHAVIFLSQILLSMKGDGPSLARRLVDIYFALFKLLMSNKSDAKKDAGDSNSQSRKTKKVSNKKGSQTSVQGTPVELDSRIFSALLTGVNRAFPFVTSEEADIVIEKETPILFQLVHSKSFNIGVQALMLLYQLLAKNQTVSDRYYRALYGALLTPSLVKSTKTEMFLGLLFKSLKADVNPKRVAAFAKRFLQVALQQPPQFACACLLLLSELSKARPTLWNAVLQPENDDKDYEHFVDIMEEGDVSAENIKEKDDTETFGSAPKESISKEINESGSESELEEMIDDKLESSSEDGDSSEDNFFESENATMNLKKSQEKPKNSSHVLNVENGSDGHEKNFWPKPAYYDPQKREPLYCNADAACFWELTTLASNFHPSVATMAKTLLRGSNIIYNGDPLADLSLGAFIDKFIEKKPKPSKKTTGEWHGGSDIAPARKVDILPSLVGPDLLKLAEEDVPPEDVVFHRFYVAKSNAPSKKSKKKKHKEDVDETIEDELLVGNNSDIEDGIDAYDESDNDEIENLIDDTALDDTDAPSDKEYDYDKLDDVFDLEDETTRPDGSDGELDFGKDISESDIDEDVSEHDDIDEIDGDEDLNHTPEETDLADNKKVKNRKSKREKGVSPFASMDDYSHLLNDDEEEDALTGSLKSKSKSKKKKLKK